MISIKHKQALRKEYVLMGACRLTHTHIRTQGEWHGNRESGCHLLCESQAFVTLKCYWSNSITAEGNYDLLPLCDVEITGKGKRQLHKLEIFFFHTVLLVVWFNFSFSFRSLKIKKCTRHYYNNTISGANNVLLAAVDAFRLEAVNQSRVEGSLFLCIFLSHCDELG